LAAGSGVPVWAQAVSQPQNSVVTYTNQAVPPASPDGVLPEGIEWNKPLKGGDLVLPKASKQKTKARETLQPPSLPVGEVKAPQIGKTGQPPLIASDKTSSASVMLMQGMKSALQQVGENMNMPIISSSAVEPAPEDKAEGAKGVESATASPGALQPPKLPGSPSAKPSSDGVAYESGRGPQDLAAGKPLEDIATKKAAFDQASIKEETPSAQTEESGAEAPKATEIQEPPVPLEDAASPPAKEEKTEIKDKPKAKAKSGKKAKKETASIFGPAVSTSDAEKTGDGGVPAAVESSGSAKTCESKVTKWIRECGESGYPADYAGKIVGETRIECPGGDTQDVWLSNTCEPPAKTSVTASAEPRATELQTAPKSLYEGASKADMPPVSPSPLVPVVPGSVKAITSAASPVPSPSESAPAPAIAVASAADSNGRVDANCGAANGSAVELKPFFDLCASGQPTQISGEGPWRWSCQGSNGGMTVSCAAPKAESKAAEKASAGSQTAKVTELEDGKCGSSDGMGTDTAPTENLCAKGIASRVNGGGPWTWACSGTNGGRAAGCSASKKVDGTCGASNGVGLDAMPERDLCATGYASAVTGEGPWNWTCSGLYGGGAATCSAMLKGNAVCGTASLTGHHETPREGLCKVGDPSGVAGEGPWSWTCVGTQGGASVSCKAPTMVDGVCGAANGSAFDKAPDDDLCTQGHAGRITGSGPWNWNCSGLEGGSTVGCTALLAGKEKAASSGPVACGSASEMAAFQTPSQNLCLTGKASAVNGTGPWSWSCSDDGGHNVACTTLVATEGACGTASNVPSTETPSKDLCAMGAPGKVTSDKGKMNWSWECQGSMGAATVSCSAPVLKTGAESDDAKCGAAAGRGTTEAPKGDLCDAGRTSVVRGKGPWTWVCSSKSGRKVNCEAPKVVDGACGPANGSIQSSIPASGLCAAGAPTGVAGVGPWLWSCVGEGGGSSVSCSAASQAQARIDGACGAAANAVMTRAPDTNLCDSGVPSTVYGEGPWTWTCSGFNGGIASTCATSKIMPKAPPPPGRLENGNCGPANGVAAVIKPKEGLCSSGTATTISGNGPWNWNCLGDNAGMTVSCTAPLMPPAPIEGVCGPSNGVTTLTRPESALCSAGIASAVSGKGPWTWSCSGTNGGGAVSCVAPLAGKGSVSKPLPATVTPGSGDEAPAPSASPAGLVTPRLPTEPLPPYESGTLPQLKPSKPLESSLMQQSGSSDVPSAPAAAPFLPTGMEPLMPPPVRDMMKPSASLKPPSINAEGKLWPGAKLELDSDVSSVSFDRGSETIDKDIASTLDKLAAVLKKHGGARITLNAYAGANGDISPREARRLSLARALAVRDYLTSKGVPSARIDVRALGANVPSGDMDRVDVKVN
ncbi:MAG: OmpA family protein, partial [Alphaproteobacteria bacterium]|nr:OmpA family protein [Alphaproteobacteria bacterium]